MLWKIDKENLNGLGLEPETSGWTDQSSSIWAIQPLDGVLPNSQLVFAGMVFTNVRAEYDESKATNIAPQFGLQVCLHKENFAHYAEIYA